MKKLKVVIGANFGDEGKGLMTDYFCASYPPDEKVLNIRFNGTSQAGHTVVSDTKRHVFSHYGAGSFHTNVHTYLSPYFYMSPIKFNEEREELVSQGVNPVVLADVKCPVITPFDIIFNCVIETERGGHCHGSCGAGLWEAVCREEAGYHLPLGGLEQGDKALETFLADVRDIYFDKRLRDSGIMLNKENPWFEVWHADGLIPNYLAEVRKMQQHVTPVSGRDVLGSYNNQVYEGAQGLLLDWDNEEYMPNLTASYTGLKNVLSLLKLVENKNLDIEVCYVTRTYLTRHGAGRFDTEVPKDVLGDDMEDRTNIFNRWQGELRWGYFDPELFGKTLEKDVSTLQKLPDGNVRRSIAFTHSDTTSGYLLTRAGNIPIENYVKRDLRMDFSKYYISTGEKSKAVTEHKITE